MAMPCELFDWQARHLDIDVFYIDGVGFVCGECNTWQVYDCQWSCCAYSMHSSREFANMSNLYSVIFSILLSPVVKVRWDARQRRSCASYCWQILFLHLQVHNDAQELQAECYRNGCTVYMTMCPKLIKHKYRLWKRKANMASNIHSHQHLMGPALTAGGSRWNLGAHAENGSSLTSDFPL